MLTEHDLNLIEDASEFSWKRDDYPRAVSNLARVSDQNDPLTLKSWALAAMRALDWAVANAAIERLLAQIPGDVTVDVLNVNRLCFQGRAVEAYQGLLKRRQEPSWHLCALLAFCCVWLKRQAEASYWFREALDRDSLETLRFTKANKKLSSVLRSANYIRT